MSDWLGERGVRDEMTIATKLGFNYGDLHQSLDPDLIASEIDNSLDRLGIDTIDLLYAHVDEYDTPQEETMRAFHRAADFGGQVSATDELVSYCEYEGLIFLPDSPTLGGCYGREDRGIPGQYVNTETRIKRDIVSEIAERKGIGGNRAVLAWMLQRDQPTVPVIGVSTREQLDRNLAALDVEFTPEERRRLDGVETLAASPARE